MTLTSPDPIEAQNMVKSAGAGDEEEVIPETQDNAEVEVDGCVGPVATIAPRPTCTRRPGHHLLDRPVTVGYGPPRI